MLLGALGIKKLYTIKEKNQTYNNLLTAFVKFPYND